MNAPLAVEHRALAGAPEPAAPPPESHPWDAQACATLIDELHALRADLLRNEAALSPDLAGVTETYAASARNFAHYLALRQADRRELQERLAELGASSLGRCESAVLANLDKVLGILHRVVGRPWQALSDDEPVGLHSSQRTLAAHTDALLGPAAPGRAVRIMVTLPSEAAGNAGLIDALADAGMDVARINCAHDGPTAWLAMAAHVRAAAARTGRELRILMDLGGPKLRTGPIAAGPAVLRLRPERDLFGRVVKPAVLGLRARGSAVQLPQAQHHLDVDAQWLKQLGVGDRIELVDARDARRTLRVVERGQTLDGLEGLGVRVEADQTLYIVPDTRLRRVHAIDGPVESAVSGIAGRPGGLFLRVGDRLRVTREGLAPSRLRDDVQPGDLPAWIACTLPEVFEQVRAGERILFDDGHIGAVIRAADAQGLDVEITHNRPGGQTLAADKGINLPDSRLSLPALTDKDGADLATVVQAADVVGLSFVQRAEDVAALRERLARLGAPQLGLLLKIETREAFENLPALILAAMGSPAAGVMIARGDLAVECGYERLAEVQEEILWAAEAAHMPVVWATQVLETLAKTGQPSRAEVTDAAMGERAECVMLNKGPHIVEAIHTLDDILRRMQEHQTKKRALLRALQAWR